MKIELALTRPLRRLAWRSASLPPPAAQAQDAAARFAECRSAGTAARRRRRARPSAAPPHARAEIQPYLEVAAGAQRRSRRRRRRSPTPASPPAWTAAIQTRRVTGADQLPLSAQHRLERRRRRPATSIRGLAAVHRRSFRACSTSTPARSPPAPTATAASRRHRPSTTPAVEVYSVYAGPTLSTHAGPLAINAAYRFGYVKVDDDIRAGRAPLDDRFRQQPASTAPPSASAWRRGELPFGWTVGAGYVREDIERLDSTSASKANMSAATSSSRSARRSPSPRGVGYERHQGSQQDFVRDATGVPVLGPGGS